jgi:hypothetical protein
MNKQTIQNDSDYETKQRDSLKRAESVINVKKMVHGFYKLTVFLKKIPELTENKNVKILE